MFALVDEKSKPKMVTVKTGLDRLEIVAFFPKILDAVRIQANLQDLKIRTKEVEYITIKYKDSDVMHKFTL